MSIGTETPKTVPTYTSMVLLSLSEHANLAMFHMKQSSNFKKGDIMELSEARERLFNIALHYALQLSVEDIEALTYGAEALKTIEDMKGETEHDT